MYDADVESNGDFGNTAGIVLTYIHRESKKYTIEFLS